GNGTGWIYFVSMLRGGLAANPCRTVHGRVRAALAPTPHFRKFRLVIVIIVSLLFPCANALTRTTLGARNLFYCAFVAFTECLDGCGNFAKLWKSQKNLSKTEYC